MLSYIARVKILKNIGIVSKSLRLQLILNVLLREKVVIEDN